LWKESKIRKTTYIVICLIMSIILVYVGHFLFQRERKPDTALNKKVPASLVVVYKHISKKINGHPQEMNILEADFSTGKVEIKPVLSYDSVFGFEKLTSMAARSGAYAATNAGFFH